MKDPRVSAGGGYWGQPVWLILFLSAAWLSLPAPPSSSPDAPRTVRGACVNDCDTATDLSSAVISVSHSSSSVLWSPPWLCKGTYPWGHSPLEKGSSRTKYFFLHCPSGRSPCNTYLCTGIATCSTVLCCRDDSHPYATLPSTLNLYGVTGNFCLPLHFARPVTLTSCRVFGSLTDALCAVCSPPLTRSPRDLPWAPINCLLKEGAAPERADPSVSTTGWKEAKADDGTGELQLRM